MKMKAISIQTMYLPKQFTAKELAHIYFVWLPTLFGGLIRVTKDDSLETVTISFLSLPLLKLVREPDPEDIIFKVVGGVLSQKEGTFSFQIVDGELITALSDFLPRLPWPIYRITQYPFHDLVMFLFSQHLLTLRLIA